MSTPATTPPVPFIAPPWMITPDFPFVPLGDTPLPSTPAPDDWRARIAASGLKASGAIFDWCVTTASYDNEPKVIIAKYGDGYAQRRPAGINTQARMWALEARNISAKVRDEILVFLQLRNGVDVFNWTPPLLPVEQQESVICPSWNFAYGDLADHGIRLYTVSMKFEQVFV